METTLKSGILRKDNSKTRDNYSLLNISTARTILYILYIFIPAAAGADKFLNLLTHWEKYINPVILTILPVDAVNFMKIAGVIEIAAGILVFLKPKIGAFVVTAWLILISLQLLAGWIYVDVAIRDLAMAAGAFCLGILIKEE